jgi:hypothetical protein
MHYLKQCETGMENDLKSLGSAVEQVSDRLREVNRALVGLEGATAPEKAVLEAARDLTIGALAAANASGRAASRPAALKRSEALLGVEKTCRGALKKGGPQRMERRPGTQS